MTGPKRPPSRAGGLTPRWLRSHRVWQAITFGAFIVTFVCAAECARGRAH